MKTAGTEASGKAVSQYFNGLNDLATQVAGAPCPGFTWFFVAVLGGWAVLQVVPVPGKGRLY